MLDDLRRSTQDDGFSFDDEEEDRELRLEVEREVREERLFLGMTPAERMLLSIFLFMNVSVMMLALLLATKRIVF